MILSFGLGEAQQADSVIIRWPSGNRTILTHVSANQLVEVEETPAGVEVPNESPQQFMLMQNYPNPFNPSTTIRFDLPHATRITLQVYDLTGRLVRTLAKGEFSAGTHSVVWDGRDANGLPVASGVYFYHLTISPLEGRLRGGSQTRKMLVLH